MPEPDVQSAVDRVAASPSFRKAPVLRDLLLYLWRQRGVAVSEYAIGTEVLGRKPDFDPMKSLTWRNRCIIPVHANSALLLYSISLKKFSDWRP